MRLNCLFMQVRTFEKPGTNICAAFLSNNNSKIARTVKFRGDIFYLPPRSISILPDCKNVVLNTQTVSIHFLYVTNYKYEIKETTHLLHCPTLDFEKSLKGMFILVWKQIVSQHNARNFVRSKVAKDLKWKMSPEPIPSVRQLPVSNKIPNELYGLLKDTTDYGWYTTR